MHPDSRPPGEENPDCRCFVSYRGVKLPVALISPIGADALRNRNTFIRAYFNAAGQLTGFDKIVYGDMALTHRYDYHSNGVLQRAEITLLDEDTVILRFDAAGCQIPPLTPRRRRRHDG